MKIRQGQKSGNLIKLIAANLTVLAVIAVAFLFIIRTFDQIGGFMEGDIGRNVQTIVSNSELSRSLVSLEIDINMILESAIRQPEELRTMSREVKTSFERINRKFITERTTVGMKPAFDDYQKVIDQLLYSLGAISGNVKKLSELSGEFTENLDAMEQNAGTLMVEYALGGKNITGLQQAYALIPFCKERIAEARIRVETSVIQHNPSMIGVHSRDDGESHETVNAAVLQLTQTLKTLTSSDEAISFPARAVLGKIPQYMDVLRQLDVQLDNLAATRKTFNESHIQVISALSQIDVQTSETINAMKGDIHSHLANGSAIIYMISVMVIVVSFIGWFYIRKIGGQMESTAREALQAKTELQKSHDELELRVQNRTADLQKANEYLKQEINERVRAETALKDSHERLVTMLDSLDSIVYVADMNSHEILFINKYTRDIFGNIEGKTCWQALQSGQTEPCSFCSNDKLLTDEGKPAGVYRWEFQNTMNGKWYLIDDRAIQWVDGRIVRLEIATDITERKNMENEIRTSLEEKEVLLQEIHHRVKNNMTVIHSLLYMQANKVRDEQYKVLLSESINRIKTMALIHERLYQSRNLNKINFNDYLRDIVKNISSSHWISPGKAAVDMDIQDVTLGVDDAIPCGLIVNELVTNSFEHAFPNGGEGKIILTMQIKDQNDVELTVADNGIGMPEDLDSRKADSLGLNLVDALVRQLRGNITIKTEDGTRFSVNFKRRN